MKKKVELRPLRNRSFYFDVKHLSLRTKLTQYISLLGGSIVEFLDRKVKYVITDRPEKDWPKKKYIEQNVSIEVLSNSTNKVELLSRGKLLALKAAPSQSNQSSSTTKTTDVLELAIRKGVKLIPASIIANFCIKYLQNSKVKESLPRAKILTPPFIKFEDNDERYRPSLKEFAAWPELVLESEKYGSPFNGKRIKVDDVNEINDQESMTMEANTAINTSLVKRIEPTPITSKTPLCSRTLSRIETPKVDIQQTKSGNKSLEGLMLSRRMQEMKERKKKLLVQPCEICRQNFTNLIEHVSSEKHQNYIKKKENLEDLIGVIESLPAWKEINSETESECESEDESCIKSNSNQSNISNNSSKSPNESFKFTLNGFGDGKGSFLPLHDYIGKKIENNNDLN